MKKIFIIWLCLCSMLSLAQVQVGMSKAYTITPASATVTAIGANYGSTVSVTCYIKNKGSVAFTGTLGVFKRVDTLNFAGVPSYYDSMQVTNFLPSDSIQITVKDSLKPSSYRQDGSGNTIVVWPYISGAIPVDSLIVPPLYIHGTVGLEELSAERLSIFPNPASNKLLIKTERGVIYERIRVYDMQSKQIMDIKFKEEIDIGDLPAGTYWISVTSKNNKRYTTKFIKTE